MQAVQKFTGYYRLLVAGNPSKIEILTLVAGAIFSIAAGVPFPIIGILFGELLDDFNGATCSQGDPSSAGYQGDINGKILIIFYLAIAQFVLIYGHLFCWSYSGARLAQRLRESYLHTLLRQEPSYFDNLPPGEVASRLDSDIQTIRSGTAEKVGICLSSFSFFVTAYIVAFIKNWELAAMLISLIPAYLLMSFIGGHYIEKYTGLMSDHAATAASIASESLSNLVVVQAFGANLRLEEKFSKALAASRHEGIKKATAIGVQSGILYFVAYAANGLAFWQGSHQIADAVRDSTSGTTVGAVFTVIFILVEGQFFPKAYQTQANQCAATLLLSQVAPFLHLFAAAVGSYEKLRVDMDRQSLIDGTSLEGVRLPKPEGKIEFKNVSFAYPSRPEITVLEEYNLEIPANKHTALIGLSGSGKSTIAGLATRLYDPNEGQILFDGVDIRDLNVFDLRSSISLVQQEAPLLDRSLLENIAHGLLNSNNPEHADVKATLLGTDLADVAADVRDGQDLETSAEKRGPIVLKIVHLVRKAATLADADDFIRALKQGYGTSVGASGRLISGGQKQRIALARALIKEPRVLILDEATASLDSRSEQRIQRAIGNIANGRTMITVAHRLSTITHADNIVVMQKGRLLEQGSHAELLARNGAYADLVKLQTLGTASSSDGTTSETETVAKSEPVASLSSLNEKTEHVSEHQVDNEKKETASNKDESADAEEDEPPSPKKSLWALAKGYAPALRPHTLVIFVALLGSVVVGGAFSGEAVIFGNTVGSLNPCKTPGFIRSHGNLFGLMFFVLAIIEFFANLISWSGFGWTSERLVYTVRVLSFRSLFEQDLEWHQSEGRTPSMLLSYITRDGNALAGLSGSVLGTLFSITVNLFAAIILTHIVAWKIALVCLSLVPLLLGCGLMELNVLGKFEERHETAYTKSVAIGVEAVTSIKLVAALSLEEETLGTYKRSLVGPRKETFKVILQASFWQAMTYFLGNCVNALSYWWGAKQIIAGNYTQTQFLIVVFSLLVGALLWAQMFALAPELSNARGAMARILSLIEIGSDGMRGHVPDPSIQPRLEDKDVEAVAESKPVHLFDGRPSGVQFSNVHFTYPARPDSKVLNGLDINVQPGQFCALVGPSGAGKSTIISLIERFYVPQSGSILVNGVDITKSRDVSFRDAIALVPQEIVLFEGTVAFNIGLGSRPSQEATMDEIIEACKLANIHDTINDLPDGYNTLCGPNGSQFSGGQKQRLSIARALVRKPKLLILDESTSALDAESEKLLQDSLDQVAKETTVIAIAHRLRTIRKAHMIFQIEAGQCLVSGTHEELMLKSETYRENAMHQTV